MSNAAPPLATSPRIAWVDVAKALGIILVFHGHLVQRFGELGDSVAAHQMKWIYSFHMPLFFFLLGLVYKERDLSFQQFIKRQFFTRLLPAWAFNVVNMVGWIGQQYLRGESGWIHDHGWLAVPQYCALELGKMVIQGRYAFNVLTWFLICIFTIELWQFGLRRLVRKNTHLIASIVGFAALATLSTVYSDELYIAVGVRRHWWHITSGLAAMVFYQLAILLRRVGILTWKTSIPRAAALTGICLALTLLTYDRNDLPGVTDSGVVLVIDAKYGNMFWFFFTSLAGTFFIVGLSQLLQRSRVLKYIGQITLTLMCLDGVLHEFFNAPLAEWITRWVPSTHALVSSGVWVLATAASIAVCVPVTRFLQRYAPFLVGRLGSARPRNARAQRPASTTPLESSANVSPDRKP
jgi:acyltransferase